MKTKKELLKKRAGLLALSAALATGTPTTVKGGILDIFKGDMTGEEIEKTLDETFKPFVDIDNAINGVVNDTVSYKHDTLQIVTTMPSTDPSEKRDYHFLNTKFPTVNRTYYEDAYGNKVKENDPSALYRVSKKGHKDIENNDYVWNELVKTNLETFEVTRNTVYLDETEKYLPYEDSTIEYGVFTDIADILPAEYVSSTYSLSDIIWLSENILNNQNYDLTSNSLKRTK